MSAQKKLLIAILSIFFFSSIIFPSFSPIFAEVPDETWYDQSAASANDEFNAAQNGDLSVGPYNYLNLSAMLRAMGCMLFQPQDRTIARGLGCPSPRTTTEGQQMYRRSAMGMINGYIASTYVPPASTSIALLDFSQQIGMPRSYAQGLGFGSLIPILPIWKAFRNLAYVVLMVFLIVIGFMIMFRVQMDAHTVVGIQQALPKIIVTLLLITFSYAIAGFLIDLMYLSILLIISVIWGAFPDGGLGQLGALQSQYLTGGVAGVWGGVFGVTDWNPTTAIKGGISLAALLGGANYLGLGGGIMLAGISGWISGSLAPSRTPVVDEFFENLFSTTGLAGAISPIIYVIILLGLLFMFVRILFLLINAYVQIVIAIVFAPLQLLMDAFPGSGGGGGHGGHGGGGSNFQNWIMNIIGNLAIFPTVIALLMVGQAINKTIDGTGSMPVFWAPPLIPAVTQSAIKFVIGFGLVSLIPNIAGSLKEALGAKAALPIGVGAPIAPFMSGGQTAMGMLQSFYYAQHSLHGLGSLIPKSQEHH